MKLPVYGGWWPWSLALIVTFGCSRSDTAVVSGTVTWEGAPMPHGDIVFADDDPHLPAAAGKIVEGTYAFHCRPGQKRVEIQSFRLSVRKTPEGKPIGEMYIPDRYCTESQLTANVTVDGENNFDFALQP
jgi:hypothetical protein